MLFGDKKKKFKSKQKSENRKYVEHRSEMKDAKTISNKRRRPTTDDGRVKEINKKARNSTPACNQIQENR